VVVAGNELRLRIESSSPFLDISPLEATMKKTLLITGALLALTAGMASAQSGINLSWNDCGAFGVLQKNFACTSNSGASTAYASAIAPTQMDQFNGMAGVIDIQTNQAALSPWWHLEALGCRANATPFISADFNFLANVNCLDPWGGGASGGSNYAPNPSVPNRARFRAVCAIPGSTGITGTDEYYMFKMTITNARTVGTGSCAGCLDGACIVLNSILMTQPAGVGDFTVINPILRQHVMWQGGAGGVAGGCPQAVPTRATTWGSVKSLYR
jgi:hypothetical protein